MRTKLGLAMISAVMLAVPGALSAQRPAAPKRVEKTPPPSPQAAAAGDRDSVLFNWQWYMGMLRGSDEQESVATLELLKSTGTIMIDGKPCQITNYRGEINYQMPGMRADYSCTKADGQMYKNIEVVSGHYAWDEDVPGAGLEPGRGTPAAKPDVVTERLIRLWASPQGAVKAAVAAGDKTKVSVEDGKAVVTFPLPGVPNAMAKATLNPQNQAEKVEVRQGKNVTEFMYEDYADLNPADDRVDAFYPGHIVEKKNGMTVLDLKVNETEVGNLYVIMPVPDSVKSASPSSKTQGAQ